MEYSPHSLVIEITEEASPSDGCFSEDNVVVKQKRNELAQNNFHLSMILHRKKENDGYVVTAIHEEQLLNVVKDEDELLKKLPRFKTTTFSARSSSSFSSSSPFSAVFEYMERIHHLWCEKNFLQFPPKDSRSIGSMNFEPKMKNPRFSLTSSSSSLIRYYQEINISNLGEVLKEATQERNNEEGEKLKMFHNVLPIVCGTSLLVTLTFLASCWNRS
jgi:hypothetical protein